MRLLLLVGALCSTGCDAIFGLEDPSLPRCVPKEGFDQATPRATRPDSVDISVFSLTADEVRGIYDINGINVEAQRNDEPVRIPLEPMYPMVSVGMDPLGEYVFFTASIEPMTIFQMRKDDDDKWVFDPKVPKGTFAGTPSDSKSGKPVRVVVRLFALKDVFQEYERQADGSWIPVNDPFELAAARGANLSPDGLVIVYDGFEDGPEERGVYVDDRDSFDETFGRGINIFAGTHQHPQLFDDCSVLYAIDESTGERALTKYVR